ncbi:MAG: RidA family protein [Burkholderiales bacterium]
MIQRYHVGKRLSQMVVHNGIVYLAGQVAEEPTQDITGQAKQVLAQIDKLLAEVGSDKTKILTATVFLPGMADFPALNAVWETWAPAGHCPARATVEAKLVSPDYKIEIQVIAAA